MRLRSATSPSFSWYRLTIFLGLAALTAGCSSESNRFSDITFSNPFASKPVQQSAAAGASEQRAASSSQIDSRPLPEPQYQQRPSYSRSQGDVTGSVRAPQRPARSAAIAPTSAKGKWHWDGGTAVTVAPGDSLETLAHRHGVPTAEIARANGFTSHTPLYPGQRVVIPRYVQVTTSVATSSAPIARPPAPPKVAKNTPAQNPVVHVVNPGETLAIIAKRYNRPLAQVAAANNIARDKAVRVGERLIIPGNYAAIAVPAAAPAQSSAANQRMAAAEPTNSARVITPAKEASASETAAASGPMGSTPQFRWPVRGRVIAGFGPKPTGQQNDGINLAVPEGTPVKAADDGVVAYAGNELKGYGNLVLVRHASGFVTAYAHASELLVKRGDPIKRGQVIARSGQTGNVSSPQLHFEIRKGSSPIDPMQYLTGAT